jgi:hypothetical protein
MSLRQRALRLCLQKQWKSVFICLTSVVEYSNKVCTLRHKEKERKNMEMMEILRRNPVPERGDGGRKAGLYTMVAKGEEGNTYQ